MVCRFTVHEIFESKYSNIKVNLHLSHAFLLFFPNRSHLLTGQRNG